ncbi:ras-related protein Rab-33B-like isoform X2 [Takifugu rubripes]|uniref:ras-related protein Rab-33B-like isoform X2 n=1 Tax=Takifugu rubripes TaxID=31033 RepID=UPI001146002E|nr:ras-related protein Rab-33B-like isoform X2 [Takifugu rubripes]
MMGHTCVWVPSQGALSKLGFSSSLGSSFSSLLSRHRTFKVVVIGDSGVGKTCLTHRLCAGEFPPRVEATIGVDFRERLLDVDGEKIKLWDTAGQERFRKSMVQHYYRNVHAVLFVYDVTCPASFSSLTSWVEECRQNVHGHEVPRFLVGNKSDLRAALSLGCQVHQERALSFARAHNMMFFETSAKSPPSKMSRDGRGGEAAPFQQDSVEDVVTSMGARLKRQKRPSAGDPPAYSGSFKVTSTRIPEKEPYVCC